MKKRIWRVILVIFLLVTTILVGGAIYVAAVLHEVPVLITASDDRLRLWPPQDIVFEQGSFLRIDELRAFYQMSGEKISWGQWISDKRKNGMISSVDDGFHVEQDLAIKSLLFNDCSDFYCFQHRLGFSEMPSLYWKTLISIEDLRYLDHFGIDFLSIFRAGIMDIIHLKMKQGGSTLTQQVVKNLFLNQEKTLSRKLKEIIYSVYLEMNYSKEQILEVYLNESYWGVVQGIKLKGVAAASLFYLDKKPQEVTAYEASLLISLLKGPSYYHPLQKTAHLKDRTNAIYKKLVEQNLASEAVDRPWQESDWQNFVNRFSRNEQKRLSHFIWRSMIHEGENFNPYEDFVFQHKALEVLKNLKEKLPNRDIAIKAIWADPFSDNGYYRYYSKPERNLAVAMEDERHSVGSTLKPLLYHFFLQHGRKMSDEVETDEFSLKLPSGDWSPKEDHKLTAKKVRLSDALLQSLNRPVVRVANEIGFDVLEADLLKVLPERLELPLRQYPAQLLGTIELSLKEAFELYRYFLTEECRLIVEGKQTMEDSILNLMADPNLTTVKYVVKGPIKRLRFFGKTGTTNKGYDNWYVAYDGKNLGLIWVGLEGQREGKNLGLYGSTTAFQIYQGFVSDRGRRFNELSCAEYEKKLKNP